VIRLIVRTAISLVGNAVGLIVAALLLDNMQLNVGGFFLAVIIFTVVLALLQPFIAQQLQRRASAAVGGVSLIATFVALMITNILSDGVSISGVGTWVLATVIVWAASLIAVFILPFLGLKKYMQERRD
jgi:putative membrane protein